MSLEQYGRSHWWTGDLLAAKNATLHRMYSTATMVRAPKPLFLMLLTGFCKLLVPQPTHRRWKAHLDLVDNVEGVLEASIREDNPVQCIGDSPG